MERELLQICFVAPGQKGPCTGYFGLEVKFPESCKEKLKSMWSALVQYHRGIAERDFEGCLNQFNEENPIEKSPISSV
ncbi:hypothetical protein L0222_01020 [bacterium]|nr:hypothetical protein [bacterium]